MKQLPEKWAIKTDDPEFWKWLNENVKPKSWCDYTKDFGTENFNCYAHVPLIDTFCGITAPSIEEGYELITIEQWREAVTTPNHTGEIEGYEAPKDIPKWNTKKGDLWTYTKNGWYEFENKALPAEWVETWKPRYKAKEKKRVVKSGWVIQVFKYNKDTDTFTTELVSSSDLINDTIFKTQAEGIDWVKKNGEKDELYTYQEVDYITEE